MFTWIRVLLAAKRLELRDRGNIEPIGEFSPDGVLREYDVCCNHCNTRSRIGITKEGEPVRWCWRCEEIDPNSSEGEESEAAAFFGMSG